MRELARCDTVCALICINALFFVFLVSLSACTHVTLPAVNNGHSGEDVQTEMAPGAPNRERSDGFQKAARRR